MAAAGKKEERPWIAFDAAAAIWQDRPVATTDGG